MPFYFQIFFLFLQDTAHPHGAVSCHDPSVVPCSAQRILIILLLIFLRKLIERGPVIYDHHTVLKHTRFDAPLTDPSCRLYIVLQNIFDQSRPGLDDGIHLFVALLIGDMGNIPGRIGSADLYAERIYCASPGILFLP